MGYEYHENEDVNITADTKEQVLASMGLTQHSSDADILAAVKAYRAPSKLSDDDILEGIDGREIHEDRRKQKPPVKKNKNKENKGTMATVPEPEHKKAVPDKKVPVVENEEEEPVKKKSHKFRTFMLIFAAAAVMATILFFGENFLYRYYMDQKTADVSVTAEQSARSAAVQQDMDESSLGYYEFLIQGKYTAEMGGKLASFNFGDDGSYTGYTSKKASDTGTYSLSADGGKIMLDIKTASATDQYTLNVLEDTGALTLTNSTGTFALQ